MRDLNRLAGGTVRPIFGEPWRAAPTRLVLPSQRMNALKVAFVARFGPPPRRNSSGVSWRLRACFHTCSGTSAERTTSSGLPRIACDGEKSPGQRQKHWRGPSPPRDAPSVKVKRWVLPPLSGDQHRFHSVIPGDDSIDHVSEQGVRQLDTLRLRVVDELRAVPVHDRLGEPGEECLFVPHREEEQADGVGELPQPLEEPPIVGPRILFACSAVVGDGTPRSRTPKTRRMGLSSRST